MRDESLNFGQSMNGDVRISADAKTELHGKIRINPNKLPYVSFDIPLDGASLVDALEKSKAHIRCTDGRRRYSLLNCDVHDGIVYPRLILTGYEPDQKVTGFRLYLSKFNEWISPHGAFEIDGKCIRKDISIREFSADIQVDAKRQVVFSSKYSCDIKPDENNERKTVVDEYVTIEASWGEATFGFQEIRDLMLQTQRLFCLLVGFELNIEYAWVVCSLGDRGSTWAPFYFAHRFHCARHLDNWLEAMVSSQFLSQASRWSTVFGRFFKLEKKPSDLWTRLAAMIGYEGFWEFEILGLVSILNRYVEVKAKGNTRELRPAEFDALKKRISETIDAFAVEKNLTGNTVVESIKNGASELKNSDIVTFGDQFDSVILGVDERIKAILDFSRSDFGRLKRIRDAAAHGYGIEKTGDDFTEESVLRNKLLLLLLHFAYTELGLTVEDQIECLYNTFHPVVRDAGVNRRELDLLSGHVREITVSGADFVEEGRRHTAVLEFDPGRNEYRLNGANADTIRTGHKNPVFTGLADTRDCVRRLYPADCVLDVEYLNKAYLKSGVAEKGVEVYSVYIVSLRADGG